MFSTPARSRFGPRLRGTVLLTAIAMVLSLFGLAGPATAVDAATATISGTVTDAGGQPIAGIWVSASANGMGNGTETAPDGTYTVPGLAAGSYVVTFSAGGTDFVSGYYGGTSYQNVTPVVVASGDSRAGIDAVLALGGSISGKVMNAVGEPLENISVEASLVSQSDNMGGWGWTGPDGTYTVRGLAAGTYRVQLSAHSENFQAAYFGGPTAADATPVVVVVGSPVSDINVALVAGGTITGTVTDGSGEPLAGVSVSAAVSSADSGYGSYGATTAADGTYTIDKLPTGSYVVSYSVWDRNYISTYFGGATSATATPVAVVAGTAAPGIDATLLAGGSITGTVLDPAGAPVADYSVSLQPWGSDDWSSQRYASTDANGLFTIAGLATGSYKVTFSAGSSAYLDRSYSTDPGAEATAVAVVVGTTTSQIDAHLVVGGSISGTVTDTAGAPLAGVFVSAGGSSNGSVWMSAMTATDGTYTIPRLVTDSYRVSFDAYGQDFIGAYYGGDDYSTAEPIPVTTGSPVAGIDAALAAGASISGTVTDDAGTPVEGVWVYPSLINPANPGISYSGRSGQSGADGKYTIRGLVAGAYAVQFRAPDGVNLVPAYFGGATYQTATTVAVDAAARVVGIDAQLEVGGTISGSVTGPDGKPVPNAFVSDITSTSYASVSTRLDGTYTLMGLPAGEHRLRFEAPQGVSLVAEYYDNVQRQDAATAIPLTKAGTVAGIDAQLAVGAAISGTVTGPDGEPVGGVWVNVNSDNGGNGYARTGADGTYLVTGLLADSYSVYFTPMAETGFLAEVYDDADQNAPTLVPATAGNTTVGIDAKLVLGGSVAGTVTGAGGNPLAGGYVSAYDPENGNFFGAQTATDGTYVVTALPAGSYEVSFEAPNEQNLMREYWKDSATAAGAQRVVVSPGGLVPNIDASMVTGGSITGVVTRPVGSDAACVEARLVGASVFEESAAFSCFSTPGYVLGGLASGDYVVRFTAESAVSAYYSAAVHRADATSVHVVQGAATGPIDAALTATGDSEPVITLTMTPANPQVGQLVTVNVRLAGGASTPTGTVSIFSFEGPLGEVDLVNGSGSITTTFTVATPNGGVEAYYDGDPTHRSGSAYAEFAVTDPIAVTTTTGVTFSRASAALGAPVTLTATVSAESGSATGTVTFLNGDIVLGTADLAGGHASLTTTGLPLGSSTVTARYDGAAPFRASSGTVSLEVSNPGVPVVTGLSRAFGATTGGTAVTLTGTGFTGTTQVLFGDVPAAAVTVVSDTTIRVTSPAHAVGLAALRIVATAGTSVDSTMASFDFRSYVTDTATQSYIRRVYTDLFNRDPDGPGLASWTAALVAGTPRVAVANGITYSREYRSKLIGGSYDHYLGRGPDPSGLQNWLAAMDSGATVSVMESGFIASPEYFAKAGSTNAGWVAKLYSDVLGRTAAPSEVAAWTVPLAAGAPREKVAMGFLLSRERLGTVVNSHYLHLLGRGIDPTGRRMWVDILGAGGRDEAIIGGIIASEEYYAKR